MRPAARSAIRHAVRRAGQRSSFPDGKELSRSLACRSSALMIAILVTILATFMATLTFPGTALAKSYNVSNLSTVATVNSDGSMDVTETRTFDFSGSFSWIIQDLSLSGSYGITDIRVSESGREYARGGSGEGTYSYRQLGDKIEVTWRFNAADQKRTFDLSYRVNGAVTAHLDVAELYWKFVGDEWEVPSRNVVVELHLPSGEPPGTTSGEFPGASSGDVRAWGHGPLSGEVKIVSPEKIMWTVPRLPARTFLEGRVTFPRELVPMAARTTDWNALDMILAQEEALASRANQARLRNLIVVSLAPLLLVACVAAAIVLQLRWGKEHKPGFDGDYYRELPGDYSPAELGCLWNFGTVGANEASATILDLARRGFLEIEVTSREEKGLGGLFGSVFGSRTATDYALKLLKPSPRSDSQSDLSRADAAESEFSRLREHEKLVIDFLFRTVSPDGRTLPFQQLQAHAKSDPRSMQSFMESFRAQVRASDTSYRFFDHETEKIRVWECIAGIFVFIGTSALAVFTGNPIGFLASLGGVILLIAGAFLRRRSPMGSTHLAMWQAFRRFLLHFSSLDRADVPSLIIWEHYLVYAVALGVAKQVINQLKIVYPEITQPGPGLHYWAWMRGMHGVGASTPAVDLVSSMTEALHSSVSAAVNYRPSSGAGRGGGFSVGGGGGGGGGGGRAG